MSDIRITVPDILQSVADQMCDKYCKWPDHCLAEKNDPDEANELLLAEHCDSCPLQQLI